MGNPKAPEILRMPATPLECRLKRKLQEEGEEFMHDMETLDRQGLYSEEERQNVHFMDILERRLKERNWLSRDYEILVEGRREIVEAFLGGRKFFREIVELEEEIDHDYEVRFDIPHTSSGEILILGVHPDYRRQGIGSELVAATMKSLRESQAVFVVVTTEKGNTIAQRLYEKFGFRALYEYEDAGTQKIYMINPLYEARQK